MKDLWIQKHYELFRMKFWKHNLPISAVSFSWYHLMPWAVILSLSSFIRYIKYDISNIYFKIQSGIYIFFKCIWQSNEWVYLCMYENMIIYMHSTTTKKELGFTSLFKLAVCTFFTFSHGPSLLSNCDK